MNVIIAGAGKVGFNLAKVLSVGHNVTIIDKNHDALSRIQESLDILPLKGSLEDKNIYENIYDKNIDFFIAVTNNDNVNIVATMIADSVLNIKKRFIRLQKDIYDKRVIEEKLNIDKVIFPVKLASESISALLSYPKANNIKTFKHTDFKLISVRVNKPVQNTLNDTDKFAVVGIERDGEFFIPSDERNIEENDLVYIFGTEEKLKEECSYFDTTEGFDIKNCVVFGARELGVSIAKSLIDFSMNVKLIEKDIELCKRADEKLEGKAEVINLRYSSKEIYQEEELYNADLFIATSNDDEYNIIKSLEARENGIKKIISINNDLEYYNIMHSLGIIAVRGPKISAYNEILEEINSSKVVVQKFFCGGKGTVFVRKIFGVLDYKKGYTSLTSDEARIFYIRDEKLYNFDKNTKLQNNDVLVVFTKENISSKFKRWIYEL